MTTELAVLLALLLLTFGTRWLPRLLRPGAVNADTYFHLLAARLIRAQRFRLPDFGTAFLYPGRYSYPAGYHYFLALVPDGMRDRLERISSAIFDTVLVAMFWYVLTGATDVSTATAAVATAAFSMSPAFLGVGTGPRAYQGTARTLGELLATAYFLCLWQFWQERSWPAALGAVLFAALALNSSKFASQVLAFFTAGLAVVLLDPLLLAVLLGGALTAVALSGGYYRRVLAAQVGHLRLYASTLVHLHPTTVARRSFRLPRSKAELVRLALYDNVLMILLVRHTTMLLAAALVVFQAQRRLDGDDFFVAWLLVALGVFALVSLPRLAHLGEADRYLEYGTFPAFLLVVASTAGSVRSALLALLLVASGLLYVLYVKVFAMNNPSWIRGSRARMASAVAAARPRGVLPILDNAPYELAYLSGCPVAFTISASLVDMSEEEFSGMFVRWPLPHPDFRRYQERYGVDHVVVERRTLQGVESRGDVHYDFSTAQVVAEDDDFVLYRLPD